MCQAWAMLLRAAGAGRAFTWVLMCQMAWGLGAQVCKVPWRPPGEGHLSHIPGLLSRDGRHNPGTCVEWLP